jgi:hypothetical protein
MDVFRIPANLRLPFVPPPVKTMHLPSSYYISSVFVWKHVTNTREACQHRHFNFGYMVKYVFVGYIDV